MRLWSKYSSREEDRIESFARRLYLIEAVQKELVSTTRGKPFRIWNDVIWMMLLDTRDAFVIHFASWLRGMYGKRGFLRQIQAHHVRALRRKWSTRQHTDRELLRALLEHKHQESFERLFPGVTQPVPRPDDLDRTLNNFAAHFAPVIRDRDNHRAHSYEVQSAIGTAMLDLSRQREYLENAQRFLNDVRLVACQSTFGYSNANFASVERVSEELVDQIVIQKISSRDLARCNREAYYDQLHKHHESLVRDPKPLFNDNYGANQAAT